MPAFKNLRSALIKILFALAFLLSSWILGFFYFIDHIPEETTKNLGRTDVVVILTGGTFRLEEGINAFANIKAEKILISGVGNGFTKKSLFGKIKNFEILDKIDPTKIELGTLATNTFENAVETKMFMDLHHYKSLRLVTSNYHIPRSMMVFKRIMPEITIVEHPVCTENFRKTGTYLSSSSLKLAIGEYNKTIWFIVYSFFEELEDIFASLASITTYLQDTPKALTPN